MFSAEIQTKITPNLNHPLDSAGRRINMWFIRLFLALFCAMLLRVDAHAADTIRCPDNATFFSAVQQCVCDTGFVVKGSKMGTNVLGDGDTCIAIEQWCPANSSPSQFAKKGMGVGDANCNCDDGFVNVSDGFSMIGGDGRCVKKTEYCPSHSTYGKKSPMDNNCACDTGYIKLDSGVCIVDMSVTNSGGGCPENSHDYAENPDACLCDSGYVSVKKGSRAINKSDGRCISVTEYCPPNSQIKQIGMASICECNAGFTKAGSGMCISDGTVEIATDIPDDVSTPVCPDGCECSDGINCGNCVAGYFKDGDTCAPCPVGSYCANNIQTPCPYGSYSDVIGQSRCTVCPNGKTTHVKGADKQSECHECYNVSGVGLWVVPTYDTDAQELHYIYNKCTISECVPGYSPVGALCIPNGETVTFSKMEMYSCWTCGDDAWWYTDCVARIHVGVLAAGDAMDYCLNGDL